MRGRGIWDERGGALALRYFAGDGAVILYKVSDQGQWLEWIDGGSLLALGGSLESGEIICSVVEKLHRARGPLPRLESLRDRFESLFRRAESEFASAAGVARELLDSAKDVVVLHGDLHHGNILLSPERGWLAIDPKGLIGERTFEVANAFYNPPGAGADPDALANLFARRLGMDRERVLKFAFAYGMLSAAWTLEDGGDPSATLAIARALRW